MNYIFLYTYIYEDYILYILYILLPSSYNAIKSEIIRDKLLTFSYEKVLSHTRINGVVCGMCFYPSVVFNNYSTPSQSFITYTPTPV